MNMIRRNWQTAMQNIGVICPYYVTDHCVKS